MTDELVTVDEARRTAGEALKGEGRLGDVVSRHGAAYVFAYHPYPGAAGARGLEAALVTVTPLDGDHVRVQVAGVTVGARVWVRRDEAARRTGPTGADE